MSRLYVLIKTLITGSPHLLLLHAAVATMLAASCGTLLLWMPGNTYSFFNPCSWIFYVYGAIFLVVSLLKYAWARGRTAKVSLPPGAVVLLIDHVLSVQSRDHALLSVRQTVSELAVQPMVFTPPASGEQMVPVRCSTCQQEIPFRVDSLKRRKERRLGATLIAVACCVLAAALEFVIGMLAQPQPHATWIFYASLVPALLVFCAGLCVMYLLSYVGVAVKNAPKGHRFRRPQGKELQRLSQFRAAGAMQR